MKTRCRKTTTIKPTRRVRAQRKFAQGVNGPAVASTSAATQERRPEPPREEPPNVIHNNVNASTFLDVVSLQGLHHHLIPVVVLERMKNSIYNSQPSKAVENKVPVEVCANEIPEEAAERPAQQAAIMDRVKRSKKARKPIKSQIRGPWNMKLRSRGNQLKKCYKLKKTTNNRFKQGVAKTLAHTLKKSSNDRKEAFTSDDNKPLTFFAGKTTGRNRPQTQSKRSAIRERVLSKKAKTAQDSNETENNTGHGAQSMGRHPTHDTHINTYDENIDIEDGETKSEWPPRRVQNHIETRNVNPCELASGVVANGYVDNISVTVMDPQPGPSGLQVPTTMADIFTQVPEELPETQHGSDDDAAHYYNEHGINRWINVSAGVRPVPEDAIASDPSLDIPQSISPGPSCPASAWVTLKEVVAAPRAQLRARCKNCKTCKIIDKLISLSGLMRIQSYVPTGSGKEGDMPQSNTIVSPDGDNEDEYLDLLPTTLLPLVQLKVQNVHDKKIVSARLVDRAETYKSNNLNLAEYEPMFDQLIETLTPSSPESVPVAPLPTAPLRMEHSVSPIKDSDTNIVDLTMHSKGSVKSENRSDNCSQDNLIYAPKSDIRDAKLVDAPVFHPTKEEFNDPIAYFEKIAPYAAKFGLCKVIPPARFTPKCKVDDEIKFDVTNQYISRLYNRWGPAARELCAIKACINSPNPKRISVVDGAEVNLPKLYHVVQRNGGLEKVYNNKRWSRVAEEMRFTRAPNPGKKLEKIYAKYLLPYDTLSHKERQEIIRKVEKNWNKRNQKMLDRALNPLHRQKRLLGESDSSEEDTGDECEVGAAMAESEDCIVPGPCMNLAKFKRVASIALENKFRTSSPTPEMVVDEYWRLVLLGTEHVCVNTASIDTGEEGYGFSKNKQDPYSKHPWNLKMLSENSGNVLRSLGAVLGVTVPSLHLGMVFSTSCWHSDPHGLPWIEFMHQGPPKMWYGIADEQSRKFRQAVETLCPTSCQNKSIWLPSDITMIPPTLLLEHNVSLCKVVQNPGEFILVLPKAYCSSICTGYTVTESVYFATHSWLSSVHQVFQEVRASCEPTMFSLEQLLLAVAQDPRTPLAMLQQVHATLSSIVSDEISCRERLVQLKLTVVHDKNREHIANKKLRNTSAWNVRDLDECEVCRMTLYLSKVSGVTGRRSSMCLQHALRLLDTPRSQKIKTSALVVVIYVSSEELNGVIDHAQQRLAPGAVEQ